MKMFEYLKTGSLWNVNMTYPSSITQIVMTKVTNNVKYKFAFHVLRPTLQGMAEEFNVELNELIPSIIHSVLVANDYKYNTLYSTLNLSYNPIENYRMVEDESITRNVNGTSSGTVTSSQNSTNTNDLTDVRTLNTKHTTDTSSTEEYKPSTTTTNKISRSSDNDNTVATSDTNINQVEGFNSNEFENDSKSSRDLSTKDVTTTTESVTDTTTLSGSDNTKTTLSTTEENTGTDTATHGGTVTNVESANGTHADSKNEDETVIRSFTRSGNIGVTTSQRMIEAEREVAMFSFVDIVTADIIKEICINVF